MSNIRIAYFEIRSSVELQIKFTTYLNPIVTINDVLITGANSSTPDLTVLSVEVDNTILTVNIRPMIPGAYYKLELINISGSHGEQIVEDGTSNVIFFVGQEEENDIRDAIINDISGIYNKEPGSLIFDVLSPSAKEIEKSLHAIDEVKSSGYLSVEVVDEEIIRGSGPFDRFNNEGVYQILRVGSTKTGSLDNEIITFNDFPAAPVSLQQILINNETVSNTSLIGNSFDGLTITLSKSPVIIVQSISLIRNYITYVYDIEQYKYGLLEYKYDLDNAYPALDLEEGQIRLNSAAVGSSFPFPEGNDYFIITYYYKKLGRIVDASSIELYKSVNRTRESAPAVATTFFLNYAPIIDANGAIPVKNGITWLDPSQNFDPTKYHPAFITELQYNQFGLPSSPGQYSVDYNTGRVFVFGVDGTGSDGTTTTPPTATYIYKKVYKNAIDYVFYSDVNEIASMPSGELRGASADISFDYEDTFANEADFIFSSHVESLNERVENRLIENIGLVTENSPVNEVFRIYNETTGEIYTINRVDGDQVFFNAITPPELINVGREVAQFEDIIQAQMVITDQITIVGQSFVAFKVELSDNNIASFVGNFIGANFNSSLNFSDKTRFLREFYFDNDVILATNLARLSIIGDYVIDYVNGIVYLAEDTNADTDVGDATYKKSYILTRNKHIIHATNVYRSPKVGETTKTYTINSATDTEIILTDLESVGEYEITTTDMSGITTTDPILVLSGTVEVSADIHRLYHIYQVSDLRLRSDPIDFGIGAIVSSSTKDLVTLDVNGVSIIDSDSDIGLTVKLSGLRKYVNAERLTYLSAQGLAELKSVISVTGLNNFINYYSFGSDGYVDNTNNRIYLPTSSGVYVGQQVIANYRAQLKNGAAVLVDYSVGDMVVDYTYTPDEILISYEYGDNILDWSISDSLSAGETYYATYRYGALRNLLRDNFGVLSNLDELSNIPDDLDRETYRHAIQGALQTYPKGPTIPAIKELVSSLTEINPEIIESVFQEWILGRDFLYLKEMELDADTLDNLPTFVPGKFGNGLLLDKETQTATIPVSSNIRFNEGTWEAFVTPNWSGIENDSTLNFDIKFDGNYNINKVFIGSDCISPDDIPFDLTTEDTYVLGKPNLLHSETGYFIWYDTSAKKWRMRVRASTIESRYFTGQITTSGEFYNVVKAVTADAYSDQYGFSINETTDKITSTDTKIKFSFFIDSYDVLNDSYDSYDSYSYGVRGGFDGIDFSSDNLHYLFDTGIERNYCRMSLYKNGKGYLQLKVYDGNKRLKALSYNIQDWQKTETHHVACSWKMDTVEERDELHLFVDGAEVPNIYRYKGYFIPTIDGYFMDTITELLIPTVTLPTIGGFDLVTIAGSNIVTSANSNFITLGIIAGCKFEILDDTTDGINTQVSPYVYVKTVIDDNTLALEIGPPGSTIDYDLLLTLSNVTFTVNPLNLITQGEPDAENVRIFSFDSYGEYTELYVPDSLTPQYNFSTDGYVNYVNVYDGIEKGDSVVLKSYGLMQSRSGQKVYIWPNLTTNILNTITPQPTNIRKINITKYILRRFNVDPADFALIATNFGGHIIGVFVAGITGFCQPSNVVTGRKISGSVYGSNINWGGLNQIVISGSTYDGSGVEILTFIEAGTQTTTKFFTAITDVYAFFTPIDSSKTAGSVELKEANPLNWQENGGDYAEVLLSIQQQAGTDGEVTVGENKFTDGYSRFGAEDVGKIINITSPLAIANTYTIEDVELDPSGIVKDSDTIMLTGVTWGASYTNIIWKMLTTSYGDSGFANGLITLETVNSGGVPYLLGSCWYEVDSPTYLYLPWPEIPTTLYVGSDMFAENQANAVIDEMRIMDEISLDTGMGTPVPSSGRSITTDALTVREFESTTQTLGLFHFNDDVKNYASFYSSYSPEYFQSSNSVNESFNQSAIFNRKKALKYDNKSIFSNSEGTIEFWVSPILDTYNDPTKRYYIDLTAQQQVVVSRVSSSNLYGIVTNLLITLPVRARSIEAVFVAGSEKNYYTGGSLSTTGYSIRLGQALTNSVQSVTIIYAPFTSQGDRFSIYKDEVGAANLLVTASGVDYQISVPVYWKKNTWHRVFASWSLNNLDNQDILVFMVDGTESGIIRYGTGLRYGAGHLYGSPTVWGSATAGTTIARNILDDINLRDLFNTVYIGADFTEQYPAMARLDNLRFSSEMRQITYLGGSGPGQLIGKDILYTSNTNTAQPVISDALTRLLLDFDTTQTNVENLATVRDTATGIFDFYVNVIDTFQLINTDLAQSLLSSLIQKLKPAHTRAFVSFTK